MVAADVTVAKSGGADDSPEVRKTGCLLQGTDNLEGARSRPGDRCIEGLEVVEGGP